MNADEHDGSQRRPASRQAVAVAEGFGAPFTIFYSADVERTAGFYTSMLGFEETYRFPAEAAPGFVALALDGMRLGVGSPPPHLGGSVQPPLAGAELCIYTDDVDAAVRRLREAGVVVRQEPTDQPWGERNAYVEDPDGRPVHLAMRLPARS